MIDLRSKLRQKLLGYYFTNPKVRHYLRELAAILEADPANLSRELSRLERQGLFLSERRGNQKHFRLNDGYPFYQEVRQIIFKTVGAVGLLRDALGQVPGIEEAHLYGSFAKNQQDAASDIDLLVIGKPKAGEMEMALRKLERRLRREIHYTLMSRQELKTRRARKDAFVADVWRGKTICLVAAP